RYTPGRDEMTTTEPRTTTAVWAFELRRDRDTTGYSGTGTVADGVVFGDGTTVLHWRGRDGKATGTVVGATLRHIHEPHTHGGDTRLVWTHGGPPLEADYARRTDSLCTDCLAPMIDGRAD